MSKSSKPAESKDLSEVFAFHGVEFHKTDGDEVQGDCPFCSKERHFFVNTKTGQYDCKSCSSKGNHYTFLQKLHAKFLKETTKEQYQELSHARSNLPWGIFKTNRLAYDHNLDRWLLPVTNGNSKIADVRVWDSFGGDKPQLRTTKHCKVQLFGGTELLNSTNLNAKVYICEGEWDAIALQWLFNKLELPQSSYLIVGVPGCGTFKEEWANACKGRDIILLYDNDTAGSEGMDRATKLLQPLAKSISRIAWPSDSDLFPEKYDLRDFICDRLSTPKKAWRELQELIKSATDHKPKKKLIRTTFEGLLKDFSKAGLHMTKNSRDALLVTLATTISVDIPGDSVWLFLVGPPGSGKSLFINSYIKCHERAVFLSKLSAQSLVSGYKTGDGSDPSLLPTLNGKCLFVKDYTAIKAMPISVQEELYGILRDCYDKSVRIVYGNGQVREYSDLEFSLVAGVTDVIHGDNRATLGERFLKFELLTSHYNPEDHIRAAIGNVVDLVQGEELVQDAMEAFLSHKAQSIDLERLPTVPEWVQERVVVITQIAAYLRAVVHREKGELCYRPRQEIGTRLAKQLIKLGRSIAIILGRKTVDKDCYQIMEKIAFDTVVGWSLEVIRFLVSFLQKHPEGALGADIATALQVSPSFVSKKLRDLQELRIVHHDNKPGKGKGHPTYLWTINPEFASLWKRAKVGEITAPHPRKKTKRKLSQPASRPQPSRPLKRKVAKR